MGVVAALGCILAVTNPCTLAPAHPPATGHCAGKKRVWGAGHVRACTACNVVRWRARWRCVPTPAELHTSACFLSARRPVLGVEKRHPLQQPLCIKTKHGAYRRRPDPVICGCVHSCSQAVQLSALRPRGLTHARSRAHGPHSWVVLITRCFSARSVSLRPANLPSKGSATTRSTQWLLLCSAATSRTRTEHPTLSLAVRVSRHSVAVSSLASGQFSTKSPANSIRNDQKRDLLIRIIIISKLLTAKPV